MHNDPVSVYLDMVTPAAAQVGYGKLGVTGDLGYERKLVLVGGRRYAHALSTHAPARVRFDLAGQFSRFDCAVAINGDVPAGASSADFVLLVDGIETACATDVRAGQGPRALQTPVAGADALELIVRTERWEFCHAVWLDPRLERSATPAPPRFTNDCLSRATLTTPLIRLRAERCIATVVSPDFECYLDDLLGSLYANGGCHGDLVAVFMLDGNDACRRVAAKYGARVIEGRSGARVNPMSKAVLYSAALFVDAEQFLCLDADMLVLGDLDCIFKALEVCPEGSILACREGNGPGVETLGNAFGWIYRGQTQEAAAFGMTSEEANYRLVVNDGLFAGSRQALLNLDSTIRAMKSAARWVDARRDTWWRNQFVFNLALARMRCGVELDSVFNVQLHVQNVEMKEEGARLGAEWNGRAVRVLHFSGGGKQKYTEWRGRYARVPDPVTVPGGGDGYAEFLKALRIWIGRHGNTALTWSFYGRTDATSAEVRDPAVFPLFAALHYLIRSNGCARVLETGTARGVSAACLASAVWRRENARVVTFDPNHYKERDDLWEALPPQMRAVIEAPQVGGLEGMAAELAAGEIYDAILLDSIHEAEHVWKEFQLAARLVRHNGLILIHDAIYAGGTVAQALDRIEAEGFGVVRLWAADSPVREDDRLGLALVENRCRTEAEAQLPQLADASVSHETSFAAIMDERGGRSARKVDCK